MQYQKNRLQYITQPFRRHLRSSRKLRAANFSIEKRICISKKRAGRYYLNNESNISLNRCPGTGYRPKLFRATKCNKFLAHYPLQPYDVTFNPAERYFREEQGEKFKRNWLSYCNIGKKVYCWLFLAFRKESEPGFLCYVMDKKHLYARIREHEILTSHLQNANPFIIHQSIMMIYNLIIVNSVNKCASEVNFRW